MPAALHPDTMPPRAVVRRARRCVRCVWRSRAIAQRAGAAQPSRCLSGAQVTLTKATGRSATRELTDLLSAVTETFLHLTSERAMVSVGVRAAAGADA
jgi:hypothetical protein